jgi:hypothetical protein
MHYTITHLDQRYFLRSYPEHGAVSKKSNEPKVYAGFTNTSIGYLIQTAKIILGLCLLICGIIMLVLPGQGIITILLSLSLLPFPGKHALEKNLLARKSVRTSLNWIRKKANKTPFIFS